MYIVQYTPLELNSDFSITDPVATFAVGALAPGCIQVDISQDMSVEGDHTFSASLNPRLITPSLTVGTPDTTVVTITDDANDSKCGNYNTCLTRSKVLIY